LHRTVAKVCKADGEGTLSGTRATARLRESSHSGERGLRGRLTPKPPLAAREISAAVTYKRKPKEHYPIATSAISKGRGGLHR